MPAYSAEFGKRQLDWILQAATPTRPAALWMGLATGTPGSNNNAASELNTSFGYSRLSALFAAANSPAGSASNSAAMTFGPFSSAVSVLGGHLWDGSPVGSSSMILYGTLQTARTVGVGDSLVIAAGAAVATIT
jgi:hypothetical protein